MSKRRDLTLAFCHPSVKFRFCPEHICVADAALCDSSGASAMVALDGLIEIAERMDGFNDPEHDPAAYAALVLAKMASEKARNA